MTCRRDVCLYMYVFVFVLKEPLQNNCRVRRGVAELSVVATVSATCVAASDETDEPKHSKKVGAVVEFEREVAMLSKVRRQACVG